MKYVNKNLNATGRNDNFSIVAIVRHYKIGQFLIKKVKRNTLQKLTRFRLLLAGR